MCTSVSAFHMSDIYNSSQSEQNEEQDLRDLTQTVHDLADAQDNFPFAENTAAQYPTGNNTSDLLNPLSDSGISSAVKQVDTSHPKDASLYSTGEAANMDAAMEGAEIEKATSEAVAEEASAGAASEGAANAVSAGAASGGIGAIAVLLLEVLKKTGSEIDSVYHSADSTDKEMGGIASFICVIICCLVVVLASWITPFASFATGVISKAEEAYSFVQGFFLSDKEKDFLELFETTIYSDSLDEYINTPRKVDAANIGIYKGIIDIAIEKAFSEYAADYVWGIDSFIKILCQDYNYSETYNTYLAQPYPYTLKTDADDSESYYTISQFLNGEIPETEINNDLNYAEIITVLSQREENEFESFSFSTFYDLLMSENVSKLLFELAYSETLHFGIYDALGNLLIDDSAKKYMSDLGLEPSSAEREDGFILTEDFMKNPPLFENGFYFHDVTVAPYGLNELYELAEIDPLENNEKFPSKINLEMLDLSENWLRRTMPKSIDLGPSFNHERDKSSLVYNYVSDTEIPTGRSLYSYLDSSVVSKKPEFKEWDKPEDAIDQIAYSPSGESVILDMTTYVNQSSDPYRTIPIGKKTVKNIGCCVCSYAMVVGYYERSSVTAAKIRDIISSHVDSSRNLHYGTLLSSKGYSYVGQAQISNRYPDASRIERIVNLLTEGKPVVMNLKGYWTYNGVTYHGTPNSHYLVIMGYDETGFYVYDPGSKNNTESGPIPYEAFNTVPGFGIATSDGGKAFYKINTISGIGGKE